MLLAQTQTSEQNIMAWWPVAGTHQRGAPQKFPDAFLEGRYHMFFRGPQISCVLRRFREYLLESENLVCGATAMNNTALGIFRF